MIAYARPRGFRRLLNALLIVGFALAFPLGKLDMPDVVPSASVASLGLSVALCAGAGAADLPTGHSQAGCGKYCLRCGAAVMAGCWPVRAPGWTRGSIHTVHLSPEERVARLWPAGLPRAPPAA